ncbi:E3 ubiquitin-protein ligase RNF213-like isoform X3 [Halichondria panicea]|uniref:E3 ubiquitin-protein ligase RNF213-like isoform X3 n=1 Tax=Halichondria panicea TaxID=6063 RepID=UPI00312B8D78
MSATSDGDVEQFCVCTCPTDNLPISLTLGMTFPVCPFCKKPWKSQPTGPPTTESVVDSHAAGGVAAGVETLKEIHSTCRTEPPSLAKDPKFLTSTDGENVTPYTKVKNPTPDCIDSPREKSTKDTEDPPAHSLREQPRTYADQVGSSTVDSEESRPSGQPMTYGPILAERVPESEQTTAPGKVGKRKRHYPRTNWRPIDGYHSESEADSIPYRSSCRDKPSNQNNAPGDEQDTVSDKQTSNCEVTMTNGLRRTDGYSSDGEAPKHGSQEFAAQNVPVDTLEKELAGVYSKPKGYNPEGSEGSLDVVFHVIIAKPVWEWDDESKVFLRFGSKHLGGWKRNIGNFVKKDIDKDYCELSCRLTINLNALKKFIPYKYVVFTPKTKGKEHLYFEFLGKSYSGQHTNRVLYGLKGGVHQQFDTVALPKDINTRTSRKWLTEKVKSFFGFQGPPTSVEMRQLCLKFYLQLYRYQDIFTVQFEDTLISGIYKIEHLFNSMHVIAFSNDGQSTDFEYNVSVSASEKNGIVLKKWFAEWLVSLTERVQHLQGAVCIVWCLFRLGITLKNVDVQAVMPILLRLLSPPAQTRLQQWDDYKILCSSIPQKAHKAEVAEAVRNICLASATNKGAGGTLSMDWIHGIPLYSFLTETFEPNEDGRSRQEGTLAKRWFLLRDKFSLTFIRKKFETKKSRHINFKYLMQFDLLTLQACVYVCPDHDLSELFAVIPPNVCTSWLSFLLTTLQYKVNNMDETSRWKEWINTIAKNISSAIFQSTQENLDSAKLLFKNLTMVVRSTLRHRVTVITAAASLVFTALQHFCGDVSADTFSEMHGFVRDWIHHPSVIGGKMLGCEIQKEHTFSKIYPELEVWKVLLSLDYSDKTLLGEWQKILLSILSERVANVPKWEIFSLLRFVEQNGDATVTDIVMESCKVAANLILSQKSSDKQLESIIFEMTKEDSVAFGKVFGAILEKRYPQLMEDNSHDWITLGVLLEWIVWPTYLKIVKQGDVCLLMEGLSKQCQRACVCAVFKFKDMCDRVLSGDITMSDLNQMIAHRYRVEKLFEAIEGEELTLKIVSAALDKRMQQYLFIENRRKAYTYICGWISEIEGMATLRDELGQDISGAKLTDLCQLNDDNSIQLLCYTSAKPLEPFADHFLTMKNHGSTLYTRPLNNRLKKILATRSDLTIAHIYSEIWQPVFKDCQMLMQSLVDKSMTLSFVDQHLQAYKNDLPPCENTLYSAVFNLDVGVSKCLGIKPNQAPLRSALQSIEHYWILCRYQKGALVFLKLRDILNLKGDFGIVERLSHQLTESVKEDQTLATIDTGAVETDQFLKDIISNPQKYKCLQTFSNCQEIIEWLKAFTQSVIDIQGFVTMALATAAGGEGDLASDKLSHLQTVGSGFASLIYEMKESDDYLMLKDRCKSLWKALVKNSNLPELLISCNKDIKWYTSVKDTQGSVETTSSYGQMANILKYGTYRVGFKKNARTVHDFISVILTRQYEELVKWNYTLDELRDLESKLVLICGNNAKNRAEVNHYLNLLHCATSIAELYLELQKAGDVTYSNATFEFKCVKGYEFNLEEAKLRVATLQDYIIHTLERDMVTWKQIMESARDKYYELNYFTTLQLLQLRKELGILSQTSTNHKVEYNILMLLKSVSPQVSSRVVIDSLQAAAQPEPMGGEGAIPVADTVSANSENKDSLQAAAQPEPMGREETIPKADKVSANSENKAIQLDCTLPIAISEPIPSLMPTLSFEDLNESQKSIYTTLMGFNYSKGHVLRAFQECQDVDYFEIETWCDTNEDLFYERDVDEDHITTVTKEIYNPVESDDEATVPVCEQTNVLPKNPTQLDVGLKIQSVVRHSVDLSHPGVKELVEAGYNSQECVEAVYQSRGDVEKAMKLLDARVMENSAQSDVAISRVEPTLDLSEAVGDGITEARDPEACRSHLELDHLGRVLKAISKCSPGTVTVQRPFSHFLKAGLPNLLVTAPDNILSSVLALYIEDPTLPLPTLEEVLLCTLCTTVEEVSLLWRRAIDDPYFRRVFCLAHAERLSNKVCDAALRSLQELSQGRTDYRLVVICSENSEEKSHIITRLGNNQRPVIPKLIVDDCKDYLKAHFVHQMDMEVSQVNPTLHLRASMVDPDNSCVRVVSSNRSGMGKSLYIKQMAESLKQATSNNAFHVTIPIHGSVVSTDTLMDSFKKHTGRDNCTIYHLDIAPNVIAEVDCILFSLLILSGISDSRGLVWRRHTGHLYMVEVTLPEQISDQEDFQTLHLLNLFPTVQCSSPKDVATRRQQQPDSGVLGMNKKEFEGPTIQRVYQYLKRYTNGQNLDTFLYQGLVEGDERDCLKIILSKCGVRDPSWAEISHFTKFLDIQLNSCENSVFCDEILVGDVMSGIKEFVVKFMIRMSQDFSTPSLEGVLARENLEVDAPDAAEAGDHDQLEQHQIVARRQWEQTSHPYIFFNDDAFSITFIGFIVTPNGDLVDPVHRVVLEPAIMRPQLYTRLKHDKINFDEDYRIWSKELMIQKIASVMGLKSLTDPDSSYVLTPDNLIKMLAIQMRFRCDIPVVIIGETGCGKTRLIHYMCDLARGGLEQRNMLILKIHGGVTNKHVTNFVKDAERLAQINKEVNPNLSTVVFFDEANTTESVGLIKEIMCDRRMNGQPVSKDLKFIAACNPYRKHSKEMIEKLEKAGLGFNVRVGETQQKLGKVPLRQFVYRVLDLPPSMRPLVYDFGQLNTGTELDYTSQIVKDHVLRHPKLRTESPAIIPAISAVLAASQLFMREIKNECSFVSLRDVERAMIVFEFFYKKMDSVFAPLIDKKAQEDYNERCAVRENAEDDDLAALPPRPKQLDNITRAVILCLSVCYHARLQDRACYEEKISRCFNSPLQLPEGAQQLRNEIKLCEEGLLDNMVLGPNIAKNAALRENVFMMAICIELRIPLFLVGKPGNSKSLAKSIVQDSMHGRESQSPVLREFKKVHIFSFQCTQLCTPESIIEVFKQAERFQAKQDIKQYVSVVVLDNIGLAEDSPSLPLKALHPLLEDGTEGSGKDHQQQIVEREKRVAFIGISNWALDPAKMNRGVMVTRGDPGKDDLVMSAESICSNKERDPVKDQLKHFFDPLSRAYLEICSVCEKGGRQLFGLRDFYSLIKMLYWMCARSKPLPLSSAQLQHSISRNFGGLELENLKPLQVFDRAIGNIGYRDLTGLNQEILSLLNPDCTRLGLIKTSLNTKDTTWHGENRYLLFLTENYAALDIMKHYLYVDDQDLALQPYILFGSSFPKDKEYTQVCRNTNQIKICMETGRTVILLNLDNYESLYDVLNQYYIYYGGVRYVDLGLQTHRVKCRVHNDFKLILIAERDTVYEKFPTPLINRLEKHFVLTSSILEDWQREVLTVFEKWIQDFSRTSDYRGSSFSEAHAFIGYQKDTPAAVVFQATKILRRLQQNHRMDSKVKHLLVRTEHHLLKAGIITQDLADLSEDSCQWTDSVIKLSKFLLVQTAADAAIIGFLRSKYPPEEVDYIMNWYFEHQQHCSIGEFLQYELECSHHCEIFMQVTTHCPLMTKEELAIVTESMGVDFAEFDLLDFDSELDFSNKIGPKFLRDEDNAKPFLVIIQCDSGHLNSDLIACARFRVCEEAIHAKMKNEIHGRDDITHVLLIIRLPPQEVKSQFVGFQGDPWISVHIGDLRPTSEATVIPEQAVDAFISELFIRHRESILLHPQHRRLHSCVQAAVSLLKDSQRDRAVLRIQKLMALIPKAPPEQLDEAPFFAVLIQLIHSALQQRKELRRGEQEWLLNEAMSGQILRNGGTFRNMLARCIDVVITPYFAKIIAHADQNSNLDLLDPKNLDSPVSRVWLAMFNLTGEGMDCSTQAEGKTIVKTDFHCQFPFSWMIREVVTAQGINVRGARNRGFALQTICETLSLTRVGLILDSVKEVHIDQLYRLYLHDFVRYVHNSSLKNHLTITEYQLIMEALDAMTHRNEFCSVDGHESLSRKIVALHLIHGQWSTEVMQFSQLVLNRPGILHSLSIMNPLARAGKEAFTLHLCAVQRVLESDHEDGDPTSPSWAGLNPPLHNLSTRKQDEVTRNLQRWLNNVRLSQNVIETILRSNSVNDATITSRLTWQRIRALQIFAETVYLPHSRVKGVPFITKKLEFTLKRHSDFLKKDTLLAVKQFLKTFFDLKQLEADKGTKDKIKDSCNRFFIEVVSSLCFGGREIPESELIELLLDNVLQDRETSALSPYKKQDQTPVIRSFLLQLLLEHEPKQVRQYMDNYYQRSSVVSRGHGMDQDLCLLSIQCFEDALHKRMSILSPDDKANKVMQLLESSHLALQEHLGTPTVRLKYLEAVAGIRFALSILAEQLKSNTVRYSLLKVAKKLCIDTRVNIIDPTGKLDTTGPVLYLIKLIVRQFGFPCLRAVSRVHSWLVPEGLKRADNEERPIDPFVLYERDYQDMRIAVNTALRTKKTTDLTTCVEGGAKFCLLAFVLYQKSTLSLATTVPTEPIQQEEHKVLKDFLRDSPSISTDLLHVLRLLLANRQSGTLVQMVASPYQAGLHRTLTGLVVHTVTVLLSRANTELLLPFINMINNPAALEDAYLPTMQDNLVHEVKKAHEGSANETSKFYKCPNGHLYLIGDYGKPWVRKTCPECYAAIGGTHHTLLADNSEAQVERPHQEPE